MRGDRVPDAQDIGRTVRRLRLVQTPESQNDGQHREGVDYTKKSFGTPLDIKPPTLSAPGEGSQTHATTPRNVKRINTLTPPQTPMNREESGRREVSARREALREERSRSRRTNREKLYRRRRKAAISSIIAAVVVVGLIALLLIFGPAGSEDADAPINPQAAPDTVLAESDGVSLVAPIRPEALRGIGYHAEGEGFAELAPRGRNLDSIFSVLPFVGSTPEDVGYHVMDAAGRGGPKTAAVDVGGDAGAEVFSPVTGIVTGIRPDPKVQGASVIEIQPTANPDLRVYVTLIVSEDGSAGVKSPVEAGETSLGTVADSAGVLDPQLAEYTEGDGNHVTVFTANAG